MNTKIFLLFSHYGIQDGDVWTDPRSLERQLEEAAESEERGQCISLTGYGKRVSSSCVADLGGHESSDAEPARGKRVLVALARNAREPFGRKEISKGTYASLLAFDWIAGTERISETVAASHIGSQEEPVGLSLRGSLACGSSPPSLSIPKILAIKLLFMRRSLSPPVFAFFACGSSFSIRYIRWAGATAVDSRNWKLLDLPNEVVMSHAVTRPSREWANKIFACG